MSFGLKPRVTYEEYLAFERKAERKSEYFNGEIFAMSGASPQHVLIVTNSETNRLEDTLELTSIVCNLMLTEVYNKVELPT